MEIEGKCFFIKSVSASKFIEVRNSGIKNGSVIQLGNLSRSSNQKWLFKGTKLTHTFTLIAKHSQKTLDNGEYKKEDKPVHQWEYYDVPHQKWRINFVSNSLVKLQCIYSNQYLTASDNGRIVQRKNSENENQLWELIPIFDITISLELKKYLLKISHQHLYDLGSFALFCMKAFNSGTTIEEISKITRINIETVKNQLEFLISREYINEKFNLLDKGKELLELNEFINNNNLAKPTVALESYVESIELKKIFYVGINNDKVDKFKNSTSEPTGLKLEPILFPYKLEKKFNEINNEYKQKLVHVLASIYPSYKTLIEKFSEELEFQIEKPQDNELSSLFVNWKSDVYEFMTNLSDIPSQVKVSLPIKKFTSTIIKKSTNTLDEQQLNDWIKKKEDILQQSFCLFDGTIMKESDRLDVVEQKNNGTNELPSFYSPLARQTIDIPLEIFFGCDIKTEEQIYYQLYYISEDTINTLITE